MWGPWRHGDNRAWIRHRAVSAARGGCCLATLVGLAPWHAAEAHDPIFGLGPHTLFQGGVELAAHAGTHGAGSEREQELSLGLVFGITGEWTAGLEAPFRRVEEDGEATRGAGDLVLSTKYRFWREDTFGAQQAAALAVQVILDTADSDSKPPLGSGTTDTVLGVSYGFEGRKWYRWASLRYRVNGENDAGFKRGDRVLLDLVGGIRPHPSGYLEPDWVWLLELNGEYRENAEIQGNEITGTGGSEWFVSPGLFWTRRNFAVKAGVQIPIAGDLGDELETDYRAALTLEWHL